MVVGRTSADNLPGWVQPAAWAAAGVGGAGTLLALFAGGAEAWWVLLVNFLFWTGLGHGLVVWSAIFRTAQATWAAGANRLAQAALNFQYFALALFVLLYVGRHNWLPWISKPVPSKALWLNEPFFFSRNLIAMLVMLALSWLYVRLYSVETSENIDRDHPRQGQLNRLAIVLILAFVVVHTLFAFDLVMSLEPMWFSTMMGPYFFIGNLYGAMAVLILMAALLRRPFGLEEHLGARRFSDLGNLLMGFGMFFTGLMFAQWLTIWYGNIPEETFYLVPRIYHMPWKMIGWMLVVLLFLGPFIALQFEALKSSDRRLSVVAASVFVGLYLERMMLVIPAFAPDRLAGLLVSLLPLTLCFGVFVLVILRSLTAEGRVSALDLALKLE